MNTFERYELLVDSLEMWSNLTGSDIDKRYFNNLRKELLREASECGYNENTMEEIVSKYEKAQIGRNYGNCL